MIPFPNISPEIFSISVFGFEISLRWYAVSYIAGFLVALYIMKHLVRREILWPSGLAPMDAEQADNFLTYLIIGVIVGGRLGYVFFYNLHFYVDNPIEIVRVWDGGMSFHGGFVGVIIAVLYFCRKEGLSLWSTADLIAVSSPPGLFFGRLANFVNAELWGRPTDSIFGVIFPGQRAQACPQIAGECARHPTQLYEAGLEGFLLFLLLFYLAKSGRLKLPGLISGLFFFGYGLSRFVVEYFRVPDAQFFSEVNPNGYATEILGVGLTMGQLLSMPMILIGIGLVYRSFLVFR